MEQQQNLWKLTSDATGIITCIYKELIMNLTDDETFQNFFLLCSLLGFLLFALSWYVLRKKGINVYTKKTKALLLLIILVPALILVWLLPDIPIIIKLIISIAGIATELFYYYTLDITGKKFRKTLGIKNEEDQLSGSKLEEKKKN